MVGEGDNLGMFWALWYVEIHGQFKECKMFQSQLCPSGRQLKLCQNWIMQRNNDPNHSIKSIKDCLKKKRCKLLQWPSQNPDLSLINMHKQMPGNFKEVKRCCKEAFLLLLKVILEAIKS